MSERLDRLDDAVAHLSADDARSVELVMLGYLSSAVSPDVWEKAIAAGLRVVEPTARVR